MQRAGRISGNKLEQDLLAFSMIGFSPIVVRAFYSFNQILDKGGGKCEVDKTGRYGFNSIKYSILIIFFDLGSQIFG